MKWKPIHINIREQSGLSGIMTYQEFPQTLACHMKAEIIIPDNN